MEQVGVSGHAQEALCVRCNSNIITKSCSLCQLTQGVVEAIGCIEINTMNELQEELPDHVLQGVAKLRAVIRPNIVNHVGWPKPVAQ